MLFKCPKCKTIHPTSNSVGDKARIKIYSILKSNKKQMSVQELKESMNIRYNNLQWFLETMKKQGFVKFSYKLKVKFVRLA